MIGVKLRIMVQFEVTICYLMPAGVWEVLGGQLGDQHHVFIKLRCVALKPKKPIKLIYQGGP